LNTLVFNCGSSSLSYKVFETAPGRQPQVVVAGKAHRVGVTGTEPAFVEHRAHGETGRLETPIPDHRTAARLILEHLRATGVNVELVGHRFVHGGSLFTASAFVDPDTLRKLRSCLPLAPLHNPTSLSVIHESRESLPAARQYVTFDSAFHCTIPDYAYTYALPRQVVQRFGFRKYGFHGLSYWYVSRQVPGVLNLPAEGLKMVACHLGTGGSSVAAIRGGRSVDTSMGYSPLPGLVMGTRSGDVDPMLMLYLMSVYGLRGDDLMDLLNKKSGLLGISGFSSDLTDIIGRLDVEGEGEGEGDQVDEQPQLAFRMYIQRVRKYVGGYVVGLGGIDALVFTDDIGVRNWQVREKVCQGMEWCGVRLDAARNRQAAPDAACRIDAGDSRVSILSVPTDEELAICLQGQELLEGSPDAAV
jgi:acetate kinase